MRPSSGSSSQLLALAGGAGIVLYFALWAYSDKKRAGWRPSRAVAGSLLLQPLGISDRAVLGIALIAARARTRAASGRQLSPGRAAVLRRPRTRRGRRGRAALGERRGHRRCSRRVPSSAHCCLIAGPWVWRLALDRDAERTARIRSDERSDVAARVHDSVLQTLALIQRHAARAAARRASLARRQERELRGWLYSDQPIGDDERLARWPRSRPQRATSRSSTACASSSRARATARSTAPSGPSCWQRARR